MRSMQALEPSAIFSFLSDGILLNDGQVEGLPASAGLNGLAAF